MTKPNVPWVSKLSDVEEEELSKKRKVAEHSNSIFESLRAKIENAVSTYNGRHPQEFGGIAVSLSIKTDAESLGVLIRKSTDPIGDLALTFPVNDGIIEYEYQPAKDSGSYEIEIDEKKGGGLDVTYTADQTLTEDEFVEEMLKKFLFSPDVIEKSKSVSTQIRSIESW